MTKRKPGSTYRYWNADEDSYIREHWRDTNYRVVAEELKRTPAAVLQRAVKLGVFKRLAGSEGIEPPSGRS